MNMAVPPVAPSFKERGLRARFYALMTLDRYLWRGAPSGSPRFKAMQEVVAQLQALSPYQAPREADPLPELDGATLTREAFLEASDHYRRPVVIRGFNPNAAAVLKWTPEHLRRRLGEQPCVVARLDEAWRERSWDAGVPLENMDFDTFMERMTDEPLYLHNSTELVTACPGLEDDLELDKVRESLTESGASWDELITTNLFVGSSAVFSSTHTAPAGNFFFNVAGRKRWIMMDPRHSLCAHPIGARPFNYCRSAYGGYRAQEEKGQGHDNPLVRLPRFEVTLQPGDLLYNAPWWWHEVYNLDAFTVGCAIRHVPRPMRRAPSVSNHPLWTATSLYPVARTLTYVHYLRQRITGNRRPLRRFLNSLLSRQLQRSLSRGD